MTSPDLAGMYFEDIWKNPSNPNWSIELVANEQKEARGSFILNARLSHHLDTRKIHPVFIYWG